MSSFYRWDDLTQEDSDSDSNIDMNTWLRLKQRMSEEKSCSYNPKSNKTEQTKSPSTCQSNISNPDYHENESNQYTYKRLLKNFHENQAKIDTLTQKLHQSEASLKAAQEEIKILKQKINDIAQQAVYCSW